jgi:hypothetical protein
MSEGTLAGMIVRGTTEEGEEGVGGAGDESVGGGGEDDVDECLEYVPLPLSKVRRLFCFIWFHVL